MNYVFDDGGQIMLVHSVYFWLKKEIDLTEYQHFERVLHNLLKIKNIRYGFVGKPALMSKPVIDRSYDYALTLVFEDQQKHDDYQVDPVHVDFVETFNPIFLKVQVYDAQTFS